VIILTVLSLIFVKQRDLIMKRIDVTTSNQIQTPAYLHIHLQKETNLLSIVLIFMNILTSPI